MWIRIKKWLTSPTLDVIIRAAVVFSIFAVVYFGYQENRTSSCLQNYIQFSSSIAVQDRKVVDSMVTSIAQAKTGPQVAAALKKYVQDRTDNDKLRADHPFNCS